MADRARSKGKTAEPERALGLWIGMLLPPVAWAVQLQTLWLTSELGCQTSNFLWNHLVSITALIVAAIGGFIAFFEYRKWAPGGTNSSDDLRSRRKFMAMVGILTGLLFTTVIFAQWLPTLLGVPCEK